VTVDDRGYKSVMDEAIDFSKHDGRKHRRPNPQAFVPDSSTQHHS